MRSTTEKNKKKYIYCMLKTTYGEISTSEDKLVNELQLKQR